VIHVPAFLVVGGGEAGAFYVRQLRRAVAAGRLRTDRIVVVDRDPACRVRADAAGDPRVRVETADWAEWLEAHLAEAGPADHLVPYHWAPHLLLGWLEGELRRAGAGTERGGEVAPRGLPFETTTRAGDRALSYATWPCPPACIEPALCPHTRGPKDWSLAAHLEAGDGGGSVPVVFRCVHLVYGVGTIPVRDVLAARDRVRAGLGAGRRSYLVATSSHCHALATRLDVWPAGGGSGRGVEDLSIRTRSASRTT
jgi:hypothetical protein